MEYRIDVQTLAGICYRNLKLINMQCRDNIKTFLKLYLQM